VGCTLILSAVKADGSIILIALQPQTHGLPGVLVFEELRSTACSRAQQTSYTAPQANNRKQAVAPRGGYFLLLVTTALETINVVALRQAGLILFW